MAEEALLIIDMLNDFVLQGAPLEVPDARKILPNVKRELERAKREGSPVVYVCDAHAPDDVEFSKMGWTPHGVKGTKGSEVVGDLRPEGADHVIGKTTYSSFHGTKLDETLKGLGADAVRLTGCVTHICILFAAYDAAVLGYGVTVVKDAVAGLTKEDHDAALRIMQNVLGAKLI